MIKRLHHLRPGTFSNLLSSLTHLLFFGTDAHFKHYVAFRYANPLTDHTLLQMKADGVTRAVAFSQYPQYSCTTTGSSLNHLWRELKRLNLSDTFKWSVIDRWPVYTSFIDAVVARIQLGLCQLFSGATSEERAAATNVPAPPPSESLVSRLASPAAAGSVSASDLDRVLLLFSAHSLPMRVVNRGDPYPQEVAATVPAVMHRLNAISEPLGYHHRYMLAWQSQVGPLPWLGPQTGEVIKQLGAKGHKHVLVVPIAFTSDHIETLFEIDMEYGRVAKEAGITHFHRSPSLNDEPIIFDALAQLVSQHLDAQRAAESTQYRFDCPSCSNPMCRSIANPAHVWEKVA